jgi:cysteine desulfurase
VPGDPPPTPAPAPALVLDCRGRRCPLPVIDLARRIGEVPVGAVVGVLADDPAARMDLPAWCRMRAHDYLGESRTADGTSLYAVRRAGGTGGRGAG